LTDDEEGIGNVNTEAFSLLVLAKNYNAWLYEEEKQAHGDKLK
jgi:hypothetical protein